jgi:cell division initiation protein
MARKKDEGGAEAGARLSPVDVQQVQFRRALRGYEEQEVDDFLDRVTEELTRLLDERRALTERAGQLPTIRVQSAGDAAAVSRQAEELVAQARERAESIVREAQQRAAAIVRDAEAGAGARAPAAAATGSGPGVAGFVTKEREFLQQLASLVQGHAQTVREMVASARESGAASGAPSPAGSGGASVGTRPSGSGGSGDAGARPVQEPGGSSGPPGGNPESGGSGSPVGQARGPSSPGEARGTAASSGGTAATESRPAQGSPTVADAAQDSPSAETHLRVPDLPESAPRSEPVTGTPPPSRRIEVTQRPQHPDRPAGSGYWAGGEDASLRELFWGED